MQKKRERGGGDQRCTAESLLWRGEGDGGRTGRTNRLRDDKKGRPVIGKGLLFLSPDEKKEGLQETRDNREHGGEEKRRDVIRG